jgi:hypothetical protein
VQECGSGYVEDENHMVFQCPVYQHVRVKSAELLESAHDLKSLFRCDSNRVQENFDKRDKKSTDNLPA